MKRKIGFFLALFTVAACVQIGLAESLKVKFSPVSIKRTLGEMEFRYVTDFADSNNVVRVEGFHTANLSTNVSGVAVEYSASVRVGFSVSKSEALRALSKGRGISSQEAAAVYKTLPFDDMTNLFYQVALSKANATASKAAQLLSAP